MMQTQAAQAAHADVRAHSEHDWSNADDETLISGMLKKDDFAWLEFLGRIDRLTTERIQRVVRRRCRMLCSTDFVDDIKCAIHAVVDNDKMRALRAFDSRHGTLAAWVCRLADQLTMRRLHELTTLSDEEE
jgi:hypothetical protein